jgi:hypothetical protein
MAIRLVGLACLRDITHHGLYHSCAQTKSYYLWNLKSLLRSNFIELLQG